MQHHRTMRFMTERQATIAEAMFREEGMRESQRWAEPGEVLSVLLRCPKTGKSVQIEWDR